MIFKSSFSEQLKQNYNLGKFYVEVDFADLKTFNEENAAKLARQPNKFMPEVCVLLRLFQVSFSSKLLRKMLPMH